MKKTITALLSTTFLLIGCAGAPPAPKGPNGETTKVSVAIDGGWEQVDTTNPNRVDQRRQLVNYMEKSALEQLKNSGYDASLAKGAPEAGARLLTIKIVNYNPGSAAARMLVGLGAGAAVLDTKATCTDGGKELFSVDNSVGSGRDWRKSVKKTSILIVTEMTKH